MSSKLFVIYFVFFLCNSCSKTQLFENDGQPLTFLKSFDIQSSFHSEIIEDLEGNIKVLGIDNDRNLELASINSYGNLQGTELIDFDISDHVNGSELFGVKVNETRWLLVDRWAPQYVLMNEKAEILDQQLFKWSDLSYGSHCGKPYTFGNMKASIGNSQYDANLFTMNYPIFDFDLITGASTKFNIPKWHFKQSLSQTINVFFVEDGYHYLVGHYAPPNNEVTGFEIYLASYSDTKQDIEELYTIPQIDIGLGNMLTDLYCNKNGEVIMLISNKYFYPKEDFDYNNGSSEFALVKANKNLNVEYSELISIEGAEILIPKRLAKVDIGYLIAGWCTRIGEKGIFPFMVTTNEQGDILSVKIFNMRESRFVGAVQASDGNLIFLGETNRFGKDVLKGEQFVLKCDREGNFN